MERDRQAPEQAPEGHLVRDQVEASNSQLHSPFSRDLKKNHD